MQRAWGRRKGEVLVTEYVVSVLYDKNILEAYYRPACL